MAETKFLSKTGLETLVTNLKSYIQTHTSDNAVIVKGDVDNSAVLKGEYAGYTNKAISQTSMAVGAGTIAGLKGWYYSDIDFTNKKITLSDKPTYILLGSTLLNGGWSSGTPNIKIDDVISLVNDSKYDFCSKVTAIRDNVITVDKLPFEELVQDNGASTAFITGQFSDGYSVYVPDRPDAGIIDFGGGAFAEGGLESKASNICAHAEGLSTHAYGQYSHSEGRETKAGYAAHAEGLETEAKGLCSHAEGSGAQAIGDGSHAEGRSTQSNGKYSHAEGRESVATGVNSHAEGQASYANKNNSHAEGQKTTADGDASHSEGRETTASGNYSHSEGRETTASNSNAHAEGQATVASGHSSHAEGWKSIAGTSDTAPVLNTSETKGNYTHAEGNGTWALGNSSHAEGKGTKTTGVASHAEGYCTHAVGNYSHTAGQYTTALNTNEYAIGKYNNSIKSTNTSEQTLFTVGIGTKEEDKVNALELKSNGDIYIFGVGNYNGTNPSANNNVKTVIGNIENKQTTLENSIIAIESDLEQLNESLENSISQLDGQIDALNTNINNIESNLQETDKRLENDINQLSGRLDTLEDDINGKITVINEEIEGINEEIEGINEEIEGINEDIENLSKYTVLELQQNNTSGILTNSNNITNSEHSIVLGFGNKTENDYEFATGKYNNSIKTDVNAENTLFSVGIGIDDEHRANALEIKQNGDVRIDNGVLYASAISRSGYAVTQYNIGATYSASSSSMNYDVNIYSKDMNGIIWIYLQRPTYNENVTSIRVNIQIQLNDLLLNDKTYCDICHIMLGCKDIDKETKYSFINAINIYFKVIDSNKNILDTFPIQIASISNDYYRSIMVPFSTSFVEINALLRNSGCYIIASKFNNYNI